MNKLKVEEATHGIPHGEFKFTDDGFTFVNPKKRASDTFLGSIAFFIAVPIGIYVGHKFGSRKGWIAGVASLFIAAAII